MSQQYNIDIEIKLRGTVSVTADSQEQAFEKADDKMFWAYQAGDPAQHKDVIINDCEITVEGEDLDLFATRDAPEDDK